MNIAKRTLWAAVVGTALIGQCTFGQDGKLLHQTPVYTGRQALPDIEVSEITYLSDGLKVKGYLLVPTKAGKYPCVIYNRGGNRDFGALTPASVATELGKIAKWGYIVVASQHRGNVGGEGTDEFGGRDAHDVLNLIPMLESLAKADYHGRHPFRLVFFEGGDHGLSEILGASRLSGQVLASPIRP